MDFELPAAWLLNSESSPTLLAYGVVFALGGVAGVVNVVAGGGAFLTFPPLIFLQQNRRTENPTQPLRPGREAEK